MFLVSLLSVVNAAWILSINGSVTANIIGGEKIYKISQKFDDFSLDTSNGPNETTTFMEIEDVEEDTLMLFEIDTRKTNLTSDDCKDYKKDCKVIVTHIYYKNGNKIRTILSDNPTSYGDETNVTLMANIENQIEYLIECRQDSCDQRIRSNITLTQIE